MRHLLAYAVLGVVIWLAFLKSGVHPTVVGVALGLLAPARPLLGERVPVDLVTDLLKRLAGAQGQPAPKRQELISPAERLEHALH
ncbi:MAG TPA: Na+/H+ antiporter NhaA, partial [Gemmataceae bacterium]|nr:Na+/H+ antiporter NhaA [Gemmataceae bacterium]